jgi:hypothetical protein
LPGPRPIQAELQISQPNDLYEQEADRATEQVMKMLVCTLSPQASQVSRTCAAREEQEGMTLRLKLSGISDNSTGEAPNIVTDALHSPGKPLDAETRT